ncbi:hypothetical protein ACWGB8_12660 [Kitasatospora sp. NPDC054939]
MGLKDRFQEKAQELVEHARSALGAKPERPADGRSGAGSDAGADAGSEQSGRSGRSGRTSGSAEETTRQLRQRPDETEGPW